MRKVLLLLVLLAILVVAGIGAFRVAPAPQLTVVTPGKSVGRKSPVSVTVAEPQRGISSLKIELIQGDRTVTLAEKTWTPAGPLPYLGGAKTATETVTVDVGRDAVKDLKAGDVTIRATAGHAGAWLRHPPPVVAERTLTVRLTPPTVSVTSSFHYINQGGCEVVLYRVGDSATTDGVESGGRVFRGWPLPGGGPQDRFALFAVPYDTTSASEVRVFAEDDAGNKAQASFIDEFFAKPLRTDTIQLKDDFMNKVVPEIMSQTPELSDKGNLLDNFLQINRDLRKKDRAEQKALSEKTKAEFLWSQPFLPMKNTAIMANFADRRTYVYQGKSVDQQDHLGLDMASTKGDAVPAANDGIVVLARFFGIYGNAVVIDHGYGLQSLYGHLSTIDVKEGQTVTRGQIIARSGATGLAGGDHLHFEIVLDGLAVSPIEWWDTKWLTDRLKRKLGPALKYAGASASEMAAQSRGGGKTVRKAGRRRR